MATVLPPLTTLIDQGAAGGHEFERLMHQLLIEDGESENHGSRTVQPLGALLENSGSTVVLGDPGTGKTTLLSFISLLLLGKAELPGYSAPRAALPLLIPLRQFVRAAAQRTGFSFIDYLVAQAHADYALTNAHPFFFEASLRMGEAFVLFDGLDEAGSAATRRRISAMIQAFRAEYPACPVWVTSRIYGYTRDVQLPGSEFLHARLGRLEDPQVQDFIRRWYVLQLPNNERERREATESLLKAVQHTPSVRRLAGNPLLLTLMAFIHQGLRKLPQDRGELYEKCVEMLLKTWQEARRGEEAPAHAFTRLGLHVLSHHPLRDDWLADGRKADKWLQGRAHIHLFGHVHAPDLEETRGGSGQRLVRIAAGAVHGERKPEGVPAGHGYSLAALYAHQEKELLLRVWPRVWSDNNTGFRPDVHNIHEERGCAEHVIAGIKLTRPA